MTWPNTTPISTENLDSGLDNPALARVQILNAVQNINAVVSEFVNVNIASVSDTQLLQYQSNVAQWRNAYPELHRYTERTANLGTASGNITIDYNSGNGQRLTANGNVTLSFANFPVSGTVTLALTHTNTPAVATWPENVRAAGNDRFLSIDPNVTDLIHISTIGSTDYYYVTLVRGYE